ncbi:MAG: ABC transporter permease [Gemmatimonadota bacterium]|nr:MAG: ABC transporter permease [Gemmatimonadota bacterium]
MNKIAQDVRYAIRNLAKSPTFATVAVLTLAIGIAANTVIFSVVNGVLLDPLPYDEPGDLVAIYTYFRPESGYDFPKYAVGSPEYFDYLDQNRTMASVAAVSTETLTITAGAGDPEIVTAGYVSSSMFSVLRAQPLLGRTLVAADDGAEPRPVFVLSYALWQRRFGGDSTVIGQVLDVGVEVAEYGNVGEIVGVMPDGFAFPTSSTQLWTQLPLDRARTWRGGHWFHMIGRLAPGVTLEEAEVEMETLMARWAVDYPDHHVGHGLFIMPLLDDYIGNVRPALLLLLAAVGFLLLIACANVANLLLARAEGRRRELAVRGALGARPARLLQQLLTESLVLALCGGVLGLLFAAAGIKILLALQPGTIPRAMNVGLDTRVLAFVGAAVLLTTVVFGLLPAFRGAAADLSQILNEAGRTVSPGRTRLAFRRFLVAAEIALAVLLVVGAGLTVKSFWRLLGEDPGFRKDNLLVAQFSLPASEYTPEQAVAFYSELVERVEALPGVRSAATISRPPILYDRSQSRFHIEGRPGVQSGPFCCTGSSVGVGPGAIETIGIPLRRGRLPDERDRAGATPVVVVDERLARQYWPGEDAIGKRIRFAATDGPWHTVVGVVGNVRYDGLERENPTFYFAYEGWQDIVHFMMGSMTIVVRTAGDPGALTGPVRGVVRSLDPNLVILRMQTIDDIVSASVARPRFVMTTLGLFAVMALLLGMIGVYGVISHSVAQRTNEIGVRIALGARGAEVIAMVLRQGMAAVLIGAGVGLAAALAATRVMAGLLYEVSPTDPWTFAVVSVAVVSVALAASLIPARRASRVDPIEALRVE